MEISQNCLELIKICEGRFLEAYRDPVGIPTIGYGTTTYPNGTHVQIGDAISEEQAEAFLKFDCDYTGSLLKNMLQDIDLTQNQYDSLVSFCYNVGIGAFERSTLRQKLIDHDFAAAAREFSRWTKATKNGLKIELPGLVKRRAKERELFESLSDEGAPLPPNTSSIEKVVKAKGFRENGKTVVVGYGHDNTAVELVETADLCPSILIALLQRYPKLKSFEIAEAHETIPSMEHMVIGGSANPIQKTPAPALERSLLAIGSEDDEEHPGNDVKELQMRLHELGYYEGAIDGVFGPLTDRAVKYFQADQFGSVEADGLVSSRTWAKLWGDEEVLPVHPESCAVGGNYLVLNKTNKLDKYGCIQLILSYYRDGQPVGSLRVRSGHPLKQIFNIGSESHAGSMEPLPEGKWSLGNIEWADGKDNYDGAVWNRGLGPAKVRLAYEGPDNTGRSAIEIHIDWNRHRAPGTAGCIGVLCTADFRTLVSWLRETDPRDLFVDWELGTCPRPQTV